ncbi:MAG: type secretion system protein ImpF [Gammaproteobacteria bacterium]|jgi:type VI secretion system protein ImpF|nr:type secretion system protein ImpF [Gammaproteobacteria bacterium]
MADLALNERLQPALLDRLIDDERTVALVNITIDAGALRRLELPEQALIDILVAQGMTLQLRESAGDMLELRFTASRAHANPSQLRALLLRPPRAPDGVQLQSFATVQSASAPNLELESAERRMLSTRRLRECVLRDLGWLFNSINLESTQDLQSVPQVASSVLNFGLPSFAGRMASSINPMESADRLRRVIELFEPRLSAVRVKPQPRSEDESDGTLEFTIEAQLWSHPQPQQLELHTRIDIMTGDITVSEGRRARDPR